MFNVDPDTKKITMHRGDTGEMTVTATGYSYESTDRALFTVKNKNGTEIIRRVYQMTNNAFVVAFANADTDGLTPGNYEWDVRYVVNPQYDTSGNIDDGTAVTTPGSPFKLELLSTVGQV